MSNDASDDKPTEYLPGGAMANAYVPRGRQSNRRITRRVAQPEPNSVEQRKIAVPNPPEGAPSTVPAAAAFEGQPPTEVIPPVNQPSGGGAGAAPYPAGNNGAAQTPATQVLGGSGATYPAAGAAPVQRKSIDPAAATPQVDSFPGGIPPAYDPQVDPEQLREDQEYEEERADKRRLMKVAAIVTAIVAILVGAVVIIAMTISAKEVVPAEQETSPSESVSTSSSVPETTYTTRQTEEPTTSAPAPEQPSVQPSATQTTPAAPPTTRATPTQEPSPTGGAETPTSAPSPSAGN
ncbi:hypothetical protein [Varibaculum prostatecancerukia]|uniref:hypothetical protein n=1 Tax=Varibaculum prostatecancerukia TaxID=2811781 RepID=UPI001C002C11|nr:hypothetical protein [Varibaculum prostatecancerukia]